MDEWLFADSPNVMVYTTRQVLEEDYPIMMVMHDSDGVWQMLCGTTRKKDDARTITLREAVEIEPRLVEVANLPLGWNAFRENEDESWIREEQ